MNRLVLLLISLTMAWPLACLEWQSGLLGFAAPVPGIKPPPLTGLTAEAAPNSLLLNSAEHLEQISQQTKSKAPALAKNAQDYERLIVSLAARHKVSPALIKAVIQAESNFNPNAYSAMGAIGLMQVMPQTARAMGVNGEAANPLNNLTAGIRYLEYLLKMFNDDELLAVAAYNCGPGKVKRFGGAPPIGETTRFVNKVMDYYHYNLDS